MIAALLVPACTFMAIGAIYSDWLDPVIDDEVSVAGLVDSVKNLPPPPPIEEQTDDEPTEKGEEKPDKQAKAAPKGPQGKRAA